jgi:hypothetical protein
MSDGEEIVFYVDPLRGSGGVRVAHDSVNASPIEDRPAPLF